MIAHCGLIFFIAPPTGDKEERLLFLGDDESGVPVEVMAIELEGDELYVIHAMPLRDKYLAEYEEAKRWRA